MLAFGGSWNARASFCFASAEYRHWGPIPCPCFLYRWRVTGSTCGQKNPSYVCPCSCLTAAGSCSLRLVARRLGIYWAPGQEYSRPIDGRGRVRSPIYPRDGCCMSKSSQRILLAQRVDLRKKHWLARRSRWLKAGATCPRCLDLWLIEARRWKLGKGNLPGGIEPGLSWVR